MNKSYEDLFEDYIKERGLEYYKDNKVVDIQRYNHRYTAKVKGSEEYRVSATFDHNRVINMTCSCPHFQSMHFCKHLYAFIYKLDHDNIYVVDKEKLEIKKEKKKNSFFSFLDALFTFPPANANVNHNFDDDDELEEKMDDLDLENWQKDLVREGKYEPEDFEEEDLDEDDYYYEDE